MTEIRISEITERINVRSLKQKGVDRLKQKISEVGYLPEKPVVVTPNGNGYILVDGNHRITALEELNISTVEALIDESLTSDALRLRRARLANEVAETVVPTTFVDDAELVWELADKGMTQTEIGSVLGWSRGQVSNYAALQKITSEAWGIIATSFDEFVANNDGDSVATSATNVAFSEGLLRLILSLSSSQQLELVFNLASKKIDKSQFKKLADKYKTRNEIKQYILDRLPQIPTEFVEARLTDIDKGGFDTDWATTDKLKITQWIEAIIAEWEQKSGTKLILGSFEAEVLAIEDGIIDLILTDPPYGISDKSKVTKMGSQIVDADFDGDDDWDSVDPSQFQDQLQEWVRQWARVLKPGGAVLTFCDKVLVSDLWRLFKAEGLVPKNVIVWEKDNPSPAGKARRNLVSSVEFVIWAVKPGQSYTFNDSDSWDKSNVINAPLCAGKERLEDDKGKTLHSTQKPLRVLLPLVEVFSNRGNLILDGFMGVGSTGKAAVDLKRRFIGIEEKEVYFSAAQRRIL